MTVTVHARKLPVAPRKLRAVIGQLRLRPVQEAIALMLAASRPTTRPITQLLQASISAARDRNPAVRPDQLLVKEIFCNEASRMYRTRMRGRGRASRFAKSGSHLTLQVEWTERPSPVIRPPSSARKGATVPAKLTPKRTKEIKHRSSKVPHVA